MAHTKGEWINPEGRDFIIAPEASETDKIAMSQTTLEYYGGYLVAESVAAQNMPIIKAAPKLLEACQKWQQLDDEIAQCHQCENPDGCPVHMPEIDKMMQIRDAAIKAALGEEEGKDGR